MGDRHQEAEVDRTLLLAVLRGALLDLLATGDAVRPGAAVARHLGNPGDSVGALP